MPPRKRARQADGGNDRHQTAEAGGGGGSSRRRTRSSSRARAAAAGPAPAPPNPGDASLTPQRAADMLIAALAAQPAESSDVAQRLQLHLPALFPGAATQPQPQLQFLPTAAPQPMDTRTNGGAAAAAHLQTVSPSAASAAPNSARLQLESRAASRRARTLCAQALVPGVVALVLSFLSAHQRLKLGRVCRAWQTALQQQSLWRGAGWHCPNYGMAQELALPPLIRSRLTFLRCRLDWLLRVPLLTLVGSFARLQRLELLALPHEVAAAMRYELGASVAALRSILTKVKLRALALPDLYHTSCVPLIQALAIPCAATSAPPLLSLWAPTLTDLRLHLSVHERGPMLTALAATHWPELHSLSIHLTADGDDSGSPVVAQALQRAVSPRQMPELRRLQCDQRVDAFGTYRTAGPFITSAWLPILPHLSTLTKLTLGRAMFVPTELSALTLFRAIGAHNLPGLRRLEIGGPCIGPADAAETQEVQQILQRMKKLCELLAVTNFGRADGGDDGDWLHSLHLLPSLVRLELVHECWAPNEEEQTRVNLYLQSIAAAPKLQSLDCPFPVATQQMARLWWRRAGKPRLSLGRFGDEEWNTFFGHINEYEDEASSGAAAALASSGEIALRELRVWRWGPLDGCCFAYLAHLPNLHTLDCALASADLRHLALLRQLRQLTLGLHRAGAAHGGGWSDCDLRAVASTRLPLLHTLRLEGDDQSAGSAGPEAAADPNFDWSDDDGDSDDDDNDSDSDGDNDDDDDSKPQKAQHAHVSAHSGLRYLLQLPALTRLAVPYVPTDTLELVRATAALAGRRSLRVDMITPASRRSDFERRWIQQEEGEHINSCTMTNI